VALPDSLDSQGQFNEKARLAFRPMALAQYMAANAARARVAAMAEGTYVVNPSPLPYTGWVTAPLLAFRDPNPPKPDHVVTGMEPWTWAATEADVTPENDARLFRDAQPTVGRFWVSNLAPNSVTPLKAGVETVAAPAVETDSNGWPVSIRWSGAPRPLFLAGFGDFFSIRPEGAFPRMVLREMSSGRPGKIAQVDAANARASVEDTGHTLIYRQRFSHPSLKRGTRILEVWKAEPRVRLRYQLYRLSSEAPESFYAAFPLPVDGTAPTVSSGGVPFVPFSDQLPGTCRDYFAIDGWMHYATREGDWLWVSRDAPLISFDKPELWARRSQPGPMDRVLVNLFNNFWYTNFFGNEHGAFEFQFDVQWRPHIADPAALAQTIETEPWVVAR
jgi:hypothetical protein